MIARNTFVITVLLILLLTRSVTGQDFKRQFKDAKELFRKENYVQAMDAFKPLIAYDQNNPYAEYASYYYGLSALRVGFATVAKDIFLQSRKLYPEWDQIDEINLQLAKIYFDQREYFQGMLVLKDIKTPAMLLDLPAMKRFYLSRISDAETLRMMMEEYPEEIEAARALVKAISVQPLPEQDLKMFDSLITKFNFNKSDFVSDTTLISRKKDRYTISLLLPFLANTLEPSPTKKKNQFVLDLYEGMKMAADTLARQGTHLDLYAYDTDRSAEVTKNVLELNELKGSDLIVGPLFQEQSKSVLEFSQKNKINMINPVSNNSEFLGKNPFALLYEPSHETLGIKSAELVAAQVRKKNCIVYFSDSPKDSVKAFSFMRKATSLGIKIVLAEEISKENSGKIYTTLATPTEFDEFKNPVQFTIKKDSIGSIYVATDDPVIFTKVISGVETRADSVLIIGNENWIDSENSSIDYSIFERLHILMEAPNYTPARNAAYAMFRKKYIAQHGLIPSDYAWLGFEFMIFVGQAIQQYGVYFQTGLAQETSALFNARYDYRNSRDNHHVPFIYFHAGGLVLVENINTKE